jgi:hypothetical protein
MQHTHTQSILQPLPNMAWGALAQVVVRNQFVPRLPLDHPTEYRANDDHGPRGHGQGLRLRGRTGIVWDQCGTVERDSKRPAFEHQLRQLAVDHQRGQWSVFGVGRVELDQAGCMYLFHCGNNGRSLLLNHAAHRRRVWCVFISSSWRRDGGPAYTSAPIVNSILFIYLLHSYTVHLGFHNRRPPSIPQASV